MTNLAQTVSAPEKGTFIFKKGNDMPELVKNKPVSKLKAVDPKAAEPSKRFERLHHRKQHRTSIGKHRNRGL